MILNKCFGQMIPHEGMSHTDMHPFNTKYLEGPGERIISFIEFFLRIEISHRKYSTTKIKKSYFISGQS